MFHLLEAFSPLGSDTHEEVVNILTQLQIEAIQEQEEEQKQQQQQKQQNNEEIKNLLNGINFDDPVQESVQPEYVDLLNGVNFDSPIHSLHSDNTPILTSFKSTEEKLPTQSSKIHSTSSGYFSTGNYTTFYLLLLLS